MKVVRVLSVVGLALALLLTSADSASTSRRRLAGGNSGCGAARVRKPWDSLSKNEQELYVEALGLAIKSGVAAEFSAMHLETMGETQAHHSCGFFAWHRRMLLAFESYLRDLDAKFACVTIPYYDVHSAYVNAANRKCKKMYDCSPIFQAIGGMTTSESTQWLYFDGERTSGFPVNGAPFKSDCDDSRQSCGTMLRNNLEKKNVPSGAGFSTFLNIVTSSTDYKSFLEGIQFGIHNEIHNAVGGVMATFASPRDVFFYSWHSAIDMYLTVFHACQIGGGGSIAGVLSEEQLKASLLAFTKATQSCGGVTGVGADTAIAMNLKVNGKWVDATQHPTLGKYFAHVGDKMWQYGDTTRLDDYSYSYELPQIIKTRVLGNSAICKGLLAAVLPTTTPTPSPTPAPTDEVRESVDTTHNATSVPPLAANETVAPTVNETVKPTPSENATQVPSETAPSDNTTSIPLESAKPAPSENATQVPLETTQAPSENSTQVTVAPTPSENVTAAPSETVTPVPSKNATSVPSETTTPDASAPQSESVKPVPTETVPPTPSENMTHIQTETAAPESSENVTHNSTETVVSVPGENSTHVPSDTVVPTPSENATEVPKVTVAPSPTENATEVRTETVAPTPSENATGVPKDTVAPTPSENATQVPAETVAPTPSENATEVPSKTVIPAPQVTVTPVASESVAPASVEPVPTEPVKPVTELTSAPVVSEGSTPPTETHETEQSPTPPQASAPSPSVETVAPTPSTEAVPASLPPVPSLPSANEPVKTKPIVTDSPSKNEPQSTQPAKQGPAQTESPNTEKPSSAPIQLPATLAPSKPSSAPTPCPNSPRVAPVQTTKKPASKKPTSKPKATPKPKPTPKRKHHAPTKPTPKPARQHQPRGLDESSEGAYWAWVETTFNGLMERLDNDLVLVAQQMRVIECLTFDNAFGVVHFSADFVKNFHLASDKPACGQKIEAVSSGNVTVAVAAAPADFTPEQVQFAEPEVLAVVKQEAAATEITLPKIDAAFVPTAEQTLQQAAKTRRRQHRDHCE